MTYSNIPAFKKKMRKSYKYSDTAAWTEQDSVVPYILNV
jgi:hypothetical protein